MDSNFRPIPQFKTEDEEREFWATHDSTDYINWSKAEKNSTFLRLRPSTRTVSMRLPESLIAALKTLAKKKGCSLPVVGKNFLAEKVEEETSMHIRSDSD